MSIARTAVRGAVWTVGLGIGSRLLGAVGTIALTRFIAPEIVGEVTVAWVVAVMAHTVTRVGLDQYIIVKHDDGDDVTFHATFYWCILGMLSLGTVVLAGELIGDLLDLPGMVKYLPGCALAMGIRRVAAIPDRILARDLRFRSVAISQALGEIFYTSSTLIMAGVFSMGGDAIVYGNIVQSVILLTILVAATSWRQWLEPCRITWQRTRDMLRFGVPLNFETTLSIASNQAHTLLFSYRFGAGSLGLYTRAYNLADIPAIHIGEHISSVLLPSMARYKQEHRPAVLIRSTALLAIIIFPLAVGLGAIAYPLIELLLPPEWQGVAPLLAVLAAMSIFRPMSWVVGSYLRVSQRTGVMFWLEALKLVLLLAGIAVSPTPVWACAGVGLAFAAHSVSMIVYVSLRDGIRLSRFLPGFVGPSLACATMAAAVLGVDRGLHYLGLESALAVLLVELVVGAVVYVPAAFLLAPGTARDLLGLLRKAYGRSAVEPAPGAPASEPAEP